MTGYGGLYNPGRRDVNPSSRHFHIPQIEHTIVSASTFPYELVSSGLASGRQWVTHSYNINQLRVEIE